jgi:hypothetical protein
MKWGLLYALENRFVVMRFEDASSFEVSANVLGIDPDRCGFVLR